jgi:hypothetical protein
MRRNLVGFMALSTLGEKSPGADEVVGESMPSNAYWTVDMSATG